MHYVPQDDFGLYYPRGSINDDDVYVVTHMGRRGWRVLAHFSRANFDNMCLASSGVGLNRAAFTGMTLKGLR